MIFSGDFGNGNIKIGLSQNGRFFGLYQPNLGIKKTLMELLEKSIQKYDNPTIEAIGLTGCGRHYVKELLSKFNPTVKTEILCQYRAITKLYPETKSIIDLGKEDSKYIAIRDKVIDTFMLNTICSGGVGNYIENVCFRFNLSLKDFDDLALQSDRPVTIGSKCAVFGMSSALNYLHKGEDIKNIVAGVIKAVVRNFLSMVKGRPINPPCIFTGGGALLKSFKKYFEEELGFEVIVPENPIFTGAYGATLYAQGGKRLTLKEIFDIL